MLLTARHSASSWYDSDCCDGQLEAWTHAKGSRSADGTSWYLCETCASEQAAGSLLCTAFAALDLSVSSY